MRVGGFTPTLLLHFDPLSAILDVTGSGFSKCHRIRGLIMHQTAKFQDNREMYGWVIRPPEVSREGLKFYPWTFFSFFFINTPRSAPAADDHKCMLEFRSWGKASTIGFEISPTPPLIFTTGRVKKCQFWRFFQNHTTLSH